MTSDAIIRVADPENPEREAMPYDVVIVGAGPAGLASAIRIKQLNPEISVCVLEKGSEVGAHILSGAVFETRALDELLPNWRDLGAPVHTAVTQDEVWWLSETAGRKIPAVCVPGTLHNAGNFIISLGNLCRFLAEQAEQLGVEIFPGFAASSLLVNAEGVVYGVQTGDMGLDRQGQPKSSYTPGMELHATYTLLAEGCRGHLGKAAIARFALDAGKDPQHYALGIKELWRLPPGQSQPGFVLHSAGWPLSAHSAHGGGFVYHLGDDQLVVGLVTDLSYSNPYLSPFDEFQRYKHHPLIAKQLAGAERLAYGARAIVKGGIQSQPRLHFPGGLLIGDDAGTLNFAKIKGSHTAMKSGMVAAETLVAALACDQRSADLAGFQVAYEASWAYQELYQQRNFGPAQHKWGNLVGSAYAFLDVHLLKGRVPWTLRDSVPDHATLLPAAESTPIHYPKPDGKLSFDKLSSVFLSNTQHEENQPCHLRLGDAALPIRDNLPRFAEPAQRYCPAGVYEVLEEAGQKRFRINAQNCVHCKTCDIKDPAQNIQWVAPEGGGGPVYPNF
jgi:electron-transferring-flavoprotein dehydrogenase